MLNTCLWANKRGEMDVSGLRIQTSDTAFRNQITIFVKATSPGEGEFI